LDFSQIGTLSVLLLPIFSATPPQFSDLKHEKDNPDFSHKSVTALALCNRKLLSLILSAICTLF